MSAAPTPTRPALRWHGGKWRLSPWIVGHFPPHRVYVEPFGGAASVLLRKPRAYAEIYNDLDGDVVNYFRVLRDPELSERLIAQVRLTPFARREFEGAYLPAADIVERARLLCIRSYMGFGSDAHNGSQRTGFRANSNRSGSTPAHDWANLPSALQRICERLRGVVIENRPAIEVMRQHDGDGTLHYVDPPYLPETRSGKSRKGGARYHVYAHEMDATDHAALAEALHGLAGMVVLSGYPSPLYARWYADWRHVERPALADGGQPRTGCLWLNRAASASLGHGPLFAEAGA